MADEPRTVRDARLAIRDLEPAVNRVRMAPASALSWVGHWYLRKAQTALRQAERAFAKADDPRLEALTPLSPQVEPPRRTQRPRRRRYRCDVCFRECLDDAEHVEREPWHYRLRVGKEGYERVYCGAWQLLPPLRRKTPQ